MNKIKLKLYIWIPICLIGFMMIGIVPKDYRGWIIVGMLFACYLIYFIVWCFIEKRKEEIKVDMKK